MTTNAEKYVTTPSANYAERAAQLDKYSPELCFDLGQTHKGYGWACKPMPDWDESQTAAYRRAFGL